MKRRSGSKRSAKREGQARAQLVQSLPGQGRDLERVGIAVGEALARDGIDAVDLVQDELGGQLVGADLVQYRGDRRDLLLQLLLRERGVGDVQDEVGDERLLERGGEALHQLVRQPADEADGVGDEVLPSLLLEGARGRVERLEEPVLDRDAGAGERVQKRRLAGVRVAGQGDRRASRCGGAPCAPSRAASRARPGAA